MVLVVEAGDIGHLELGDAGQLLDLDALERVDVGFALAVGGDVVGELLAASHGTGPCCWIIPNRSRNIGGMPLNGSLPDGSPDG